MRIKAKPTKYCGVQFRSRIEAKYTALFNSFDEPWTYEPKRFKLPSGSYLPDFFMPRLQIWVEIKGKEPTALEQKLCVDLSFADKRPVAIAYGWPPCHVAYQPGLWVYANGVWHRNTYFAFHTQHQKLSICCPSLESSSWCDKKIDCVAIDDFVQRNIDDKFKKRIRAPSPKKR